MVRNLGELGINL